MLKSASGRHDLRSPRRRIRSAISARPPGRGARLRPGVSLSVYAFVMQSRYLWSRGQLSNIVIAKDGHANHYAPYGNRMDRTPFPRTERRSERGLAHLWT